MKKYIYVPCGLCKIHQGEHGVENERIAGYMIHKTAHSPSVTLISINMM